MSWNWIANRTARKRQRFSTNATRGRRARSLSMESLESRVTLAAAGLVDVGVQPDGGLDRKIVYLNAGHGNQAANTGSGAWSWQRTRLLNMIEDLGNQDQMSFLADYLFRAGATVVPMRPIGYQPNEVVLDNVDVGVTFSGAWSNSNSTIYFGDAGETPYRYASTSATETAVATYRPTITVAGNYPVYAWTRSGSDRAADQLYRVNHSGGSTEVTVNHRMVGNGMIYLGTYYFEAGTSGSVEISNRSSESGRVVIADMIRFGNGMGDTDRGAGVSGRSREDELSLYWIKWQVDHSQGVPLSSYRSSSTNVDGEANVGASPRYAAYMNREQEGTLADRLLISYHSNAGGGRGVTVLHNTASGGATPNQLQLAQILGTEINGDLVAQNGQFEHAWNNRGSNITYQADFNYGELNNSYINGEFDATIIEIAFHDNQLDAELLRDARVRDAAAKASYQGIVKYFRAVDGNSTPLTMLPGKVTQVRAEGASAGSVKISWTPPTANSYNGDAPIGYRIYGSTNGYGFDGGTYVAGGATASFVMTGLDAAAGPYYFKVVAVNAGGEGAGSEVVAATPVASAKKVLIVNGFDRLDRNMNPTQTASGGIVERVRPQQSNSFDYAVQVASAIRANAPNVQIDATSNEYVSSGAINLSDYEAVFWILGEESTTTRTFDALEQTAVSAYLANGGKLFLSGSEIGWDLDSQGGGVSFYNNVLKADYVADDAASYNATGVAGSIFAGLSVAFDNGTQFYNVDYPDRIAPLGGSTAAFNYATGGAAAIQHTDSVSGSQVVMLAFPFETITSATTRNSVMQRVVDYFNLLAPPAPVADFNSDGVVDGADFLAWQRGFGKTNAAQTDGDADFDGTVSGSDLDVWKSQFGSASQQPSAVASAALRSAEGEPATSPLPKSFQAPTERSTANLDSLAGIPRLRAASDSPQRRAAPQSALWAEPSASTQFMRSGAAVRASTEAQKRHSSELELAPEHESQETIRTAIFEEIGSGPFDSAFAL
ncbi:fibronectin type III domain-containing protein [Lacipirellula sp.]|uniref:golvesin C-terminal-like domain-containing protein n=1 Tax=Lacipirellula sp. TaxID=2691419 RepID=UPI003D12B2E2